MLTFDLELKSITDTKRGSDLRIHAVPVLTVAPPQAVSQPLHRVFVVVVTRRLLLLLLRRLLAVLRLSPRRRRRGSGPPALHRAPRMVPGAHASILLPARRSSPGLARGLLVPAFDDPGVLAVSSRCRRRRVVPGARGVGGAAAAQGGEHGAGAGVQREGGRVRLSDPGARRPVRLLDEAHEHHALVSSILDLLLGGEQ